MKIYILLIFSFIYSNIQNSEIEYLIYTSNTFSDHAERISNLYQNQIESKLSLNTQILFSENISPEELSEYLYNEENNYVNTNDEFNNLQYLLIIGDENIINPLFYLGSIPSDDYFSSKNQNTNIIPNPKLVTGRILINEPTSFSQIENIENYILNPEQGKWKSELLLFCDDQFKSGKTVREEKWHTLHSNVIYNSLKSNLNISCLYGPDFNRQQSLDWYTQPEFTDKLIDKINNGVSFINYIGHGTSEVLSDEHILSLSDIDRINISNNKLPVWVVGTCSFGNYINENCLAEKILENNNVGIAVISTTGGVSYQANFNYLKDFFINNLKNYLENLDSNTRLGDLFFNSKNSISSSYTFHLFGDPAIPIILPKLNQNLINDEISSINIGASNNISISESGNSFLKVYDKDKNKNKKYFHCLGCDNYDSNDSCYTYPNIVGNCEIADSIEYTIPGNTLFQGETNSNNIEFIIPIDSDENNLATLKLHNDGSNTLQSVFEINMVINNDSDLFSDQEGPNIQIFQNGMEILEGSTIYSPYNILIEIDDELPINLSGLNYHNIRFWIDDDQINSIILNDNFNYYNDSNSTGYINMIIPENIIENNEHTINIEAWDILNNQNTLSYEVNFSTNENISNVYNFPNPFREKTFFTFIYSGLETIDVQIEIYTLNGKIIMQLEENNLISNGNHFYKIPENGWNGKNKFGNKIANGTYIYYLKIETENEIIHKGLYKITKLE